VIPQAFEYDILSNTILAIVTFFPLEDPYMTQDGCAPTHTGGNLCCSKSLYLNCAMCIYHC
jgi:hypothetical protein